MFGWHCSANRGGVGSGGGGGEGLCGDGSNGSKLYTQFLHYNYSFHERVSISWDSQRLPLGLCEVHCLFKENKYMYTNIICRFLMA